MRLKPTQFCQRTSNVDTRLPLKGLLLLIGLTLVWGASWPIMKIAVEGMPIFVYRFISAFGCGVFLLTLTRMTGRSLALPRRLWLPILAMAIINVTLFLYFSAVALQIMPSGHASVMAYTMPLWVFLIGIPVLGDRPRPAQWLGLALGLGAIAVLMLKGWSTLGEAPMGIILMGAGAICWATGTVIMKKMDWQKPMSFVVGWQFLIGSVPFIPLMWNDLATLVWPGTKVALAVSYTLVLALAFGFWAWFRIIEMVPASVASLSVLAIPAIGVVSGALILDETIGVTELTALALLLGALATVVLPKPD
ncbi:MAG: EamA family transporter [Alphaproteobacteria bacterium]|nr:EamA family transporter [Alphaproteobacteria bacterium]